MTQPTQTVTVVANGRILVGGQWLTFVRRVATNTGWSKQ